MDLIGDSVMPRAISSSVRRGRAYEIGLLINISNGSSKDRIDKTHHLPLLVLSHREGEARAVLRSLSFGGPVADGVAHAIFDEIDSSLKLHTAVT